MVEPAPTIFLDTQGGVLNLESPVVDAPEGEVIQGEVMDLADNADDDKADKKAS